jgi:hypothetical protein
MKMDAAGEARFILLHVTTPTRRGFAECAKFIKENCLSARTPRRHATLLLSVVSLPQMCFSQQITMQNEPKMRSANQSWYIM